MKGKGGGAGQAGEPPESEAGLTHGKGEGEGGIGQEAPQTAAHFGASFGQVKGSHRPQVSLRRGPQRIYPGSTTSAVLSIWLRKFMGNVALG